MSGHSKWSTIKRKKGAADAKRSKVFSKLVKEIQIATREGGPDSDSNPRLRLAVQNAKGANMPKDNIERAISKASADGANFQEITFEGYAPNGVGIFIECLTDNKNRTVSNIRFIFTKHGGSLGTNGSLKYVFERKGVFTIPKAGFDPEEFELELIDAGAEEIEDAEDSMVVTCALENFGNIQKKLDEMGIQPENAELQRIPITTKKLGVEDAMKILRLVDDFEEDDDVQNVYHNLEMTDELMHVLEED